MYKKRKKDNRTYKNFNNWPTAKLKEVINNPFHQTNNGADYAPYIDEILVVFWERENKAV